MCNRVINPVELIESYLKNNYYPRQRGDDSQFHSGIIRGAAALKNELSDIKQSYCWDHDYGVSGLHDVMMKAIEVVEQKNDCYNQSNESNSDLLMKEQNSLLQQKAILGTPPITLL